MPDTPTVALSLQDVKRWHVLKGPLLTVGLLLAVEVLDHISFRLPDIGPIFLLCVAYSAFTGGMRFGLISSAITLLYAFYFFSTPGRLFAYSDADVVRIAVLGLTTIAMALLVGVLKQRSERAAHETLRAKELQLSLQAERRYGAELREVNRMKAEALVREQCARVEAETVQARLVSFARARDRALAEAELLNTIAIVASGEEDLGLILSAALDQLARLIRFSGGSIALIEGDDLVIRAAIGPFAAKALGQRVARGPARSWQIIQSGEPYLCNDLLAAGVKTQSAELGRTLQSYLAVPLVWRGQSFGLLEVDSTEVHVFQPADLDVMRVVAAALNGPIEMARRYAQQVLERQRMEQLAAERAAILRQKEEILAARNQALRDAEAAQRRLSLLADASTALVTSLDYEATLASVAHLVVPQLADWCIVHRVEQDGVFRRLATAHVAPQKIEMLEELEQLYSADHNAPYGYPSVARNGCSELISEVTDALLETITREPEHLARLRELAPVSEMCVPLLLRGQIFGTITFALAESGRRYEPADLTLAEELARRVSLAVENAQLYREAQDAVRARDQFLSIASHELKTPLTSLLGHAQLLQRRHMRDGVLPERDLRALRVIVGQVERLDKLVVAMLDFSRIQTGQLSIERDLLDLRALTQRVVEEAQLAVERHTITLGGLDEPLNIEGDELRLEQALQNLIGNAIKYSPEGGVIRVRLGRRAAWAYVTVADQGIGIPEEALPRLFQRFYRAGNVSAQQISGLGLGLYVVKEIVSLHGGEVDVTSREGRGSTFTMRLPLATEG